MNFQEELDRLLSSVDGAKAAILMGFDGIPVAEKQVSADAPSIMEPVIEYGQWLKDAAKIAQANQLGSLNEVVLFFGEHKLLFRMLTPAYFAVMLLSKEATVGKGRFMLRKSSPSFEKELQ